MISSGLADWWTQLSAELVDEWRTETIPERDNLLGDKQSDNKRHVIVRGSFLDHFFRDDRTTAIIDEWVSHSPPLGEKFLELASAADGLAAVLEAQEEKILLTYENEFIVPTGSDEKIKLLVRNTNSKLRRFRSEVMKYWNSDEFRQVVSEINDFVEDMRLPWKWLVWEVFGVYLARVRSEEHTSELQSRRNLVCRLLLEKKKKMFFFVFLFLVVVAYIPYLLLVHCKMFYYSITIDI